MRVKCNKVEFATEYRGEEKRFDYSDSLLVGEEYIVVEQTVHLGESWFGDVSFGLKHLDYIQSYPSEIFDVLDARPSRYWSCKIEKGAVKFWPTEFFKSDAFHHALSEGDQSAISIFKDVFEKLTLEYPIESIKAKAEALTNFLWVYSSEHDDSWEIPNLNSAMIKHPSSGALMHNPWHV